MSLSLGRALAFFTTPAQVNTLITEALATRGITIDAANYTALTTNYPASSYNGAFAWVEAAQGTAWLPGTMGGTYYPLGLYHSNGTDWVFTPSPSQATQSEVDTGTNNDKFVTPQTLFNDSKWATKNVAVTVSNTTTDARFYPTLVSANGALTTLNTNTAVYVNPSVGSFSATYVNCSNTVSSSYVDAAQVSAPNIISTNGGDGSTSAVVLSGQNNYGGANYYGAITLNNTSGTNGKKFLRINATGGLEIINNAYSATIWSLSDAGSCYSPTFTSGTITSSGDINASGFINGTNTIIGNSATAFKAQANAVNNVSLEMPNTSAIRNVGDAAENIMYFDINTGGSNRGNFKFRGTSSYTTYANISPDGIQALTPYSGKTSFNVPLDTEVTVDNYKFRISSQGGVFPQVASSTGSNVDTCWTIIGFVFGTTYGTTGNSNSGTLVNGYTTLYSGHGMDTRGDCLVATITDKNAGKIYRVTFVVSNNSSNTTGYNILVERII